MTDLQMTDPTDCDMNKQQLDVVLYTVLCSHVPIILSA